ncbi:MarR family winged helix-turn-helix transcriptional regulator [Roseibium salinum]|nr:MarR family transcriptional regulator [Roseibium sp. DSM 29163]
MSETNNQMSLLDAIGFSASEPTPNPKRSSSRPGGKTAGGHKAKGSEDAAGVNAAGGPPPTSPDEAPASPPDLAGEPLTLDRHLCFALYSANHAMHGVYKALLKEVGLTYPQFLAMTVLWETNNVPVGTITSKLQLDTNTLTPLLKRLEAMGLVTRTRNTKDERQVILKLTRKGRALQKKTEHFGNCIFSATGLRPEEVAELQKKVMQLRDNLRAAGVET